jgi:hypothetical protein
MLHTLQYADGRSQKVDAHRVEVTDETETKVA